MLKDHRGALVVWRALKAQMPQKVSVLRRTLEMVVVATGILIMFSSAYAQSKQELSYEKGYECTKNHLECVRPCYTKENIKNPTARTACADSCLQVREQCKAEYDRRIPNAPSVPCNLEFAETIAVLAAEDEYCFGKGERGGAVGGIKGGRALAKEHNWCDAAKSRLRDHYMAQVNRIWRDQDIDCAHRTSRLRALTK